MYPKITILREGRALRVPQAPAHGRPPRRARSLMNGWFGFWRIDSVSELWGIISISAKYDKVVPRSGPGLREHVVHAATARSGKLYRARSRLCRSQILQVSMRLKALTEIYTMHSFAQLCNLNFFCQNLPENCQKFSWILQRCERSVKFRKLKHFLKKFRNCQCLTKF